MHDIQVFSLLNLKGQLSQDLVSLFPNFKYHFVGDFGFPCESDILCLLSSEGPSTQAIEGATTDF